MLPASLHRRRLRPGVPVYRFSGRKTYSANNKALQEETHLAILRTMPAAMVEGIDISTSMDTSMGMKGATPRIDEIR